MQRKKNSGKPSVPEGVRYDTMVGARYTKQVKDRLEAMAMSAGKIYPDFVRGIFDRILAEEDAAKTGA
jgi:hypothetical protein